MTDVTSGGFDSHHPPSAELVSDCVHCGFCLPTCPTYLLWGEEMDSPRGRIHLMKQVLEGEPLDVAAIGHFDACLGCMSCVTACPSGVKYDALIEATRGQVERTADRAAPDRALRRLIFSLFPYPNRLRALRGPLRAYQRSGLDGWLRRRGVLDRLPDRLGAMADLLPELTPAEPVASFTPAVGERRARVGMLLGCVQRAFFPGVNAATVRVLAAEGCDVIVPPGQACCGALSLHAGRETEALVRARRLIAVFESQGVDAIVVNAAGCGSAMKDFGRLLADEPHWAERARRFSDRCVDVSELIERLGPVATRHPLPVVAAYHDACHLAHAQGIRAQPRSLLAGIPGLTVREIAEPDICCGSAGVYNLLNPEPARELGDRKAANVAATGASLLVTANPGCLMQVHSALRRTGQSIALAHTVEVLDASIRGLPSEAVGRVSKRGSRQRDPGRRASQVLR
jgi:glycolate oxidase iron-sulfur subunit